MLNLVELHWLILYLKQCVRSLLPGFFECIPCVPTFINLVRVFDCKTQKKENKSPGCVTNLDGSRHSYCSVFQISFLDYMAYLPLFLSIHQNICDNALDMSRNKYQRKHTTWPQVTLETHGMQNVSLQRENYSYRLNICSEFRGAKMES